MATEHTPTTLAEAEHALATLRANLRHLPAPSSISIQSFPEQPASVFLLAATAEDVRACAATLETEAGEYDAGDGVVHTSTEATVLGVPVRVTHVSDGPDAEPSDG